MLASAITTFAAIFGVIVLLLTLPWWKSVIAVAVTAYLTWLVFSFLRR